MFTSIIQGVGAYLPEHILTNHDLEKVVETNDEWIVSRTGISERKIASPDQATSDLAFEAANAALHDAKLEAQQLDMIIVATETPDYPFPPVACQLQHRLGCRNIAAYDLHLVCTGFVAALHTADALIRSGTYKHILVVGAETLSKFTDYTDRSTCILFSDGAGAFVVSRCEDKRRHGIIRSTLHSDGAYTEAAYIPAGGSRNPEAGTQAKAKIVMQGNTIFKMAVSRISETIEQTALAAGISLSELDWIVPHQANQRIIDAIARQLNLPEHKVISTIRTYGNNSAATIPIAMYDAVKDGKIRRDDKVMLAAFGGGLAWGSVLLEY